jgi:hypothetical protein
MECITKINCIRLVETDTPEEKNAGKAKSRLL